VWEGRAAEPLVRRLAAGTDAGDRSGADPLKREPRRVMERVERLLAMRRRELGR
jgi:hypothetical protein